MSTMHGILNKQTKAQKHFFPTKQNQTRIFSNIWRNQFTKIVFMCELLNNFMIEKKDEHFNPTDLIRIFCQKYTFFMVTFPFDYSIKHAIRNKPLLDSIWFFLQFTEIR